MHLLPAILFGICVGCFCWFLVHYYQTRSLVSGRISELPGKLSFPYDITQKLSSLESKKTEPLTLDDSYQNKIARQLFLGGFRNQAHVRVFRFLTKLGFILPLILILFFSLSGSLTSKNLALSVFLGCGIALYVQFILGILKRSRQKRISRSLPQFLDLLVVCIEAGLNFTAALPRVLQEFDPKEPIAKEFNLMHYEFLNGIPLAQACERLAKRCDVVDLSIILNAVIQAEQMGAALANTLRVQASELRDKYRQRMREKAHQLPLKLVFPAFLIFITIFIIALGPPLSKFIRLMEQSQPQDGTRASFPIGSQGVSK